ncbi:hypothetical protein L226DRAFT_507836 [Lentinus tigrinus ALCF2SS1-7]|uniref:F-box domain-containing protein n=1 Tax=Lentinus tigrinus ALCF2SS1-6 TaxID=1328759 RepID=A0A5C2SCT7_9APHY|nr:hypothetical protein L227DRAFT_574709 [Lentinus tigrinus ALCF2SS1-6]RPD75160.1 hypothetical protein L226DRAFT_507836 [Lentinus tigrinus ALCF2SS1-7]
MSSELSVVDQFPPELLSVICAYVYASGLSPPTCSLDPHLCSDHPGTPIGLPSSYPSAYWPEAVVRRTLASLCQVNQAWYEAAKPWLWRKVEIRLPRSWLSIVEEVAGGDDEEANEEQAAFMVGQTLQKAETAALAARSLLGECSGNDAAASDLHSKVMERLTGPDISIPPELLTPPASRDPSPRRLRTKSKSPARWKLMRSISVAVQDVMERAHPGIYVPPPHDPHPGRLVQHLDFNHFRTIGMRRSVEEGVNNRFVTGDRLVAVLKELPNLRVFGATEYMDGALTFPVLKELLLRGSSSRGRGRPARGRDVVIPDPNDPEQEDLERRRECKDLAAIDMTGCVSGVFVSALTQFVNTFLLDRSDTSSDSDDERERRRPRSRNLVQEEPLVFPGMRRLGLRGVKSIQSHILEPLVLAFPHLTHLDLSCTRISPEGLAALGASATIRLQSLALERCNWLTGESIRDFLVGAPAAEDIRELSLYGDWTYSSPLDEEQLHDILAEAPCFKSGRLVYLDLSSTPLTRELLLDICPPQPRLRSLGLSHIRNLELTAIVQFLTEKANKVEVLTLVTSTPELGYGDAVVSARQATIALHTQLVRPLCTPPFSFSLTSKPKTEEPPTRLRVIELAPPLLTGLGAGAGTWRIIRSKGGRGWYVDTASGWVAQPSADGEEELRGSLLRRDLEPNHPWRVQLEALADANGNVSSGVGWHARKMEVLHGDGLLGREAGLYGAVSFAYQG